VVREGLSREFEGGTERQVKKNIPGGRAQNSSFSFSPHLERV
jgi:hypothetical protein